ncbi:hypothetical protein [Microbacterium sp. CFBP9034]|uniref:hypothetical protein n=1 Tax=Microbacterium sp. CFBP9034 TaxID=3096540 RepID=UPI002A6AEE3C|nr:hypothetical protein [Microbacterium sp. CFBP9034]MDY0908981.1 hypothetical protein [Microbacterium sp. CFBP9034]
MAGASRGDARASSRVYIGVVVALLALLGATLVPAGTATAAQSAAVAAPASVASGIVKAADLSKFQPGNIISDAVFFNRATMTEAQIQAFLQSKMPACRAGYTCLKDYYDTSRTTTADPMCGAYSGGVRERASRIIHRVAQACGLNPQVILVMLQKEQGLILSSAPEARHYRAAMGQGCPDTAACDTRYYGFFNQVYGGAWQLKRYANPPGTSSFFTWYAPGKTWNILYNPDRGCGSSPVYVQNQATANLYYYTPYQPNAAAIRAGYGEGDGCSAYGNRNFYQFFTDWFGSTQIVANACAQPSSAAPAAKAYVVTADVLNARLGPSTACTTSLMKLPLDTVVRATAVWGDWLKVDTASGGRWVARAYLRYATTAESACALPGRVSAAQYAYVTTADTLARTVPNGGCATGAEAMTSSTIVQAISVSADRKWVKVHAGAADRWVDRAVLRRATTAETPCAIPGGVSSAGYHYIVRDLGTTARQAPQSGCSLGAAPISGGTVVQALEASAARDWVKVTSGRGEVWLTRSHLTRVSAGAACTVAPAEKTASRSYVVVDGGAIARTAPSAACAESSGGVAAGTVLTAFSATIAGDWIRVSLSSGDRWIARVALRTATTAEVCAAPIDVRTASRSYVLLMDSPAYATARTMCGSSAALAAGSLVTAIEATVDGTWINVDPHGGDAWVPRQSVRYATTAESCPQPADARAAKLTYVAGAAAVARLAPTASCSVDARTLAAGTKAAAVQVTSDGLWIKLSLPEGQRWVLRSQLAKWVSG